MEGQCTINQRIILTRVLACYGAAYTDPASRIHKIDPESIKFLRKASKTTKRHYKRPNSKTKLKSRVKQRKAQV